MPCTRLSFRRMPKLIAAAAAALSAAMLTPETYAQQTYKFGIANDLTGPSAYHGKTFAAGFNIYLQAVNEAGGVHGRKIELIQENAERSVQKELGFLRKFAEQDKVLAAMIVTSDGMFAAKPLIERMKTPLTAIGIPELASNPPHPWVFNLFASYQDTVFAAVDYIFKTLKDADPKVAVLYPDNQYGIEAVTAADKAMEKYNKKLIAKVVMNFRETDATTQMLTLKNAGAKYVIVQLTGAHIAAVLRDRKKVGLDATIFGTTQTMDREPDFVMKVAGGADAVKAFIGIGPWTKWNEANVPGIAQMRSEVKKYEKVDDAKLGEIMYSNFVQGYVTAMVFVDALRRAGPGVTPEKLRDALAMTKNFDTKGITPPISFAADRRKGFSSVRMYKIDTDKAVYVPISGWVAVQ